MTCDYCGGDTGEVVKLLAGRPSCSACRVSVLISGRSSLSRSRTAPTLITPTQPTTDEAILGALNA